MTRLLMNKEAITNLMSGRLKVLRTTLQQNLLQPRKFCKIVCYDNVVKMFIKQNYMKIV